MIRLLAVAVLLAAWPLESSALTGEEFLAQCSLDKLKESEKTSKSDLVLNMTYCSSLVRGVVEGHYATAGYYKNEKLFCVPAGKSYMDLTGVVYGYIAASPKYQKENFGGLAIVYLGKEFPCEKKADPSNDGK